MTASRSLKEIKQKVIPIVQEFGLEKVALFGSYARGDFHERSDLDFVIKKGNVQDYYQFYDFVTRLEKEFNKPVDVLTYDSLADSYIADAMKDEVVIYEK